MRRRETISERLWPGTPEAMRAAALILADSVDAMLAALWSGYDRLREDMAGRIQPGELGDDPERNITELLHARTVRALTGFEPFDCRNEHPERETRRPSPARCPTYDIAFVLKANERIAWPAEAKVVPTAGTTTAYVREVREQYLTCRYAPFSPSGAMLAYIVRGSADDFLRNVGAALDADMGAHARFGDRHHRISHHARSVPTGKGYPAEFACHHLALPLP